MTRKVKLPTLFGEKITDNWYVGFSVFDERTGKLKRFRKYKGFSELATVEERRKYGLTQVVYWEAKLRDLKYNPFADDIVVLEDDLEYRIHSKEVKHSKYNCRYFLNMYFKENLELISKFITLWGRSL